MESISLLSNAKINLFFAINGIASDNFCNITSIMAPISCGDNMIFSLEKNTSIQNPIIKIFQHTSLKFPENNNTITRAIELFCTQTNIVNFSLRIDVKKKIPIGGGFGGGSSNGVFTLKALNQLYNFPISEEKLTTLTKKMGTDCSFFIKNSPQLAVDHGDILMPVSTNFHKNLANYFVLVFCPSFFISTDAAYKKFKQKPSFSQNSPEKVKRIFTEKHFESLLSNAFQQQILDEYAELRTLFNYLYYSNYYPCITGSGSGCFILHREYDALRKAQEIIFEQLGLISLCEIVRFL
ncbi:MAG: hypothetical protein LBH08_03920 [Puniceicoccales bacterium]|jgi:4-diphosphocytidyl-2-C-methyl-D-erythritol kinase|nr:hypothetical protein [Puniceicoccales bacterium]